MCCGEIFPVTKNPDVKCFTLTASRLSARWYPTACSCFFYLCTSGSPSLPLLGTATLHRSPDHMSNMLILTQILGTGEIDFALIKWTLAVTQYWSDVIWVVAVITFFGERGLFFRGNDELLGWQHTGNYLGILELISQFDPFLEEQNSNL